IDGLGNAILLAAALALVARRGRNDLDGVIDATIVGLAAGPFLWGIATVPRQVADADTAETVSLFLVVFALTGVLGVLIRLAQTASECRSAMRLLSASLGLALVANLVYAVSTSSVLRDVASVMFLAA